MRCLPFSFKDIIEYGNPKTLEEAMRKANFYYEQRKIKEKVYLAGRVKEKIRKGFKPNRNFGNSSQNHYKNTY